MFFFMNNKVYHTKIMDLVDFTWSSGTQSFHFVAIICFPQGAFYVESNGNETQTEIKLADISWIGVVGYYEATKQTPGTSAFIYGELKLLSGKNLNVLHHAPSNSIPGGSLHTVRYVLD